MKAHISYTKPSITELEIEFATDAARNGWGQKCYEYIEKFENGFKDYIKSKYAIATSSCTGALHMGLAALGIGPGDEVILADTNWIATAAPVTYLSAKPVFVDILPDTWCLDPAQVEKAITPNTKAIIATHLYGNLCDMDRLIKISTEHKIPLIEDAAEAIGSYWAGKHTGTIGTFGVFSFHGTKTLTTGEGGMLVTNDSELYDRVCTLSNHGRSRKSDKQFWPEMIGFKYRISNIQAAIGCAQLQRIDSLVARKREIFKFYFDHLSHLKGISLNPAGPETINGYWMPNVVFDKKLRITRESIQKALHQENIDARVFFWPLSSLPMFEGVPSNTNSYDICSRSINLPSYHDITEKDLERICQVIQREYNNNASNF